MTEVQATYDVDRGADQAEATFSVLARGDVAAALWDACENGVPALVWFDRDSAVRRVLVVHGTAPVIAEADPDELLDLIRRQHGSQDR